VLFFMRSTVYVRNFESTLRLLAERGHDVHVVAEAHRQVDPSDLVGRLCREQPRITHAFPPKAASDRWARLGIELRRGLDSLRYLGPEYRDSPKLRRRAEHKQPRFVSAMVQWRLMRSPGARALAGAAVRCCDRALPRDPTVEAFIASHRPDLVLVTPLVEPGSPQSVYLRGARALGIRTGLCVYSWDNLTNKGLIHDPLDLVAVWNQPMKDEAVTLHRVPAARVAVTGAPAYDHWFSWQPREARQAFCERVGLRADRPFVLYVCSSKFIAPNERPFVVSWIARLRASSGVLREAGVLVRPHPQNAEAWRDPALGDLANVAVWPPLGGNPVDADSRSDYYDSIHHSAAVVGVNTSAQIESAIVGRGVYTLLTPEFHDTQAGTLHFRHLRDLNGGLLHVAEDFGEHVAQLEAAVRDPRAAADRCRQFVEAFVRPYGLSEAATPRLVDALEAAASVRARPARAPWWAPLLRPALARAATAPERADAGERPDPIEKDGRRGPESTRRLRSPVQATAVRDSKASNPFEPRAQATGAAPDERTPSPAGPVAPAAPDVYARFVDVRARVRGMRLPEAGDTNATPSERRMFAALDGLWEAGPEVVARLRRCGEAVTGVRASDYENAKPSAQARLEHELARLLEHGDTLWRDEPTTLGGFGFDGLGRRYNEDTLRFFRVMSLLEDAGVLKDFRGGGSRRTVWEIGGGWGGFAYHFKSVCPDVTYLITGAPEQLLLSASYVRTQFPAADVRFYDPLHQDAFWQDWARADFAFAPDSAVADLQPPSLMLTVDVAALERMSPARIGLRVARAHALGSRYFVSVCPADEPDPELGSHVRPAVERWYWPHPLSAPQHLAKRFAVRGGRQTPYRRTYLLGWRRLHA
jgi:hypothetical protein